MFQAIKTKPVLRALGMWAVLVLCFSTRTEVRGAPFIWIPITWVQALKISLAQWSCWGFLALLIIWIDRRLPLAKDALLQRFLIHAPLSIVFAVAYTYLYSASLTILDAPIDSSILADSFVATAWRALFRNYTFLYWVIVGTHMTISYQNHLKDREIRTSTLETLLADARWNALRSQLQPHFLFNALNAVSAKVESKPKTARLMLERLAELLRLSLVHIEGHEIPLRQEMAFVDKYLQLQAMRFEDRLTVTTNTESETLEALVPPFILQPLVENAIRHGACARSENGKVVVTARRVDGHVHLAVSDNGPGLPPGWTLEFPGGIGIENTRARLRHLYGNKNHTLEIVNQSEGGVRVKITLPYRSAANAI